MLRLLCVRTRQMHQLLIRCSPKEKLSFMLRLVENKLENMKKHTTMDECSDICLLFMKIAFTFRKILNLLQKIENSSMYYKE